MNMLHLKINKRFFIVFCIVSALTACERKYIVSHTRQTKIISALNKQFICTVQSDADYKTATLNGFDTIHVVIKKEHYVERMLEDQDLIKNYSVYIYNLTDTTLFSRENIDFYDKHIRLYDVDYEDTRINYYYDAYTLTINDSLLPIFTKDYSMLEQFSEYYQEKSH